MPIPDYLVDQTYDYIKAKGFSWKDFSSDQILGALRMRDIKISLHERHSSKIVLKEDRKFDTIECKVPFLGVKSRWGYINPLNSKYFKAYTIEKKYRGVCTSTNKTGEIECHSYISSGNSFERNLGSIFIGNRVKDKRKKFKIRKNIMKVG